MIEKRPETEWSSNTDSSGLWLGIYDTSYKQAIDYVDPKDADYIHVLEQANGDFVYTSDPHFMEMGARVMPTGLDRVLRDYARSMPCVSARTHKPFILLLRIEQWLGQWLREALDERREVEVTELFGCTENGAPCNVRVASVGVVRWAG